MDGLRKSSYEMAGEKGLAREVNRIMLLREDLERAGLLRLTGLI